jgi:hypothetical protein
MSRFPLLFLGGFLALLPACSLFDDFDRLRGDLDGGGVGGGGGLDGGGGLGGGGGSLVDGSVEPLTPETFLPLFASALCSQVARCETKLDAANAFLLAHSVCPANGARAVTNVLGAPVAFDPTTARQCLDVLASNECSVGSLALSAFLVAVSECKQLFADSAPIGGACEEDFQCAEGRCASSDFVCGDVCVDRGDLSETCESDLDCDAPYVCRGGACALPGTLGQTCTQYQCAPDYWCSSNDTCLPLSNVNETCAYAPNDSCRGSLVCTLVAPDERECRVGGDHGDSCSADEPCAPGSRCGEDGECHALSAPGGTCVSSEDCFPLSECLAERCVANPVAGGTCSPLLPCVEGVCVEGTCVLLPEGGACGYGLVRQCEGYCDFDVEQCASRKLEGEACSGASSDGTCQEGLGCIDVDGTFRCQPCA